MKFFVFIEIFVFLVCVLALPCCRNQQEKDQIQGLIKRNLAAGPQTDNTLLGIKFGDSRISYQKKIDSLYQEGAIYSLVPDSLLEIGAQDLSYYKYYYSFDDYDALEKIKWIFSPVFEDNRLVELALITTPILDKSITDKSFDIYKGVLRNIIDTSGEVMADADITYRITKTYFNRLYGAPGFVSESQDQCYWFKGNCVVSITNTMSTIRIQFKDSKLK